MVFIWADFGQAAQVQINSKKGTHSLTSKKLIAPKKIADHEQVTPTNKETKIGKKKIKATHASAGSNKHHKKTMHAKHTKKGAKHKNNAMASNVRRDIATIPSFEQFTLKPSDLWLAKDSPEAYRQLMTEGQPDDLTLKILESAYSYLGTPYRWGGTTPDGFDCSGFVRHVFRENGIQLSRSSRQQAQEGKPVPLSDLKPGDLIFFNMHHRKHYWIDHVGLYVGNGQFIHATSSRSREIRVEELESKHYLPKVVKTRRVLDYTRSDKSTAIEETLSIGY
jgi:cell wall-associated NlpC family hydrolase